MRSLQKTLAIIALLFLITNTARLAYIRWVDSRPSELDSLDSSLSLGKVDPKLKSQIEGARSLSDLVTLYEPVHKQGRLGVTRKLWYRCTWALAAAYPVWLLAVIALKRGMFDWVGGGGWVEGGGAAVTLFVVWPLAASIVALSFCVGGFTGSPRERPLMVVANILMIIMWASSVVAPN